MPAAAVVSPGERVKDLLLSWLIVINADQIQIKMKRSYCKIKLWYGVRDRGEILIPLNTIDFNQISTFVKKTGPVDIKI